MSVLEPERATMVPLIFDDVIVGRIMLSEKHDLTVEITAPGTQSYLKELFLSGMAEAVCIDVNYVEPPENHVPGMGHLRLVREQ